MAIVLHNLDNSNRGGIQEMILRLHRYSRHTHEFWAGQGTMAEQMAEEGLRLWTGGPPADRHYDVVVGHTVGGWSCNGAADWAHERGAKFVECLHSIHPSPTDPARVDAFVTLSNLALAANPSMRAMRAAHRALVIYAPINGALYDRPPAGERRYIGRLSRLVEEKRPMAFAQLAPQFPGERFLIAGDGPERSRINGYPNLFFTGWLTDPHRFYSQLKLFVFPTRDECCCVSVAQAQMAGVPVVCQDIPALRETTGGMAAFCNSQQDFIDAMRDLLDNADEHQPMVDAARAWAQSKFDLPATVGKWDALVEELTR